jgi:hypothetical protein
MRSTGGFWRRTQEGGRSRLFVGGELLAGQRCVADSCRAVSPGRDRPDPLPERRRVGIQQPKLTGLAGRLGDGFGQLSGARPAVGEVVLTAARAPISRATSMIARCSDG